MKVFVLPFLAAVALVSAGCDGTVSATFSAGEELQLSAAELGVPDTFQGGASDVPSIACSASVPCPPVGIPLTCVAAVCDPDAILIETQVGNVIDMDMHIAMLSTPYSQIESVEILDAQYNITVNTLTFGTSPVEIYWAPAGAVSTDPAMGAQLLGTIPAIDAMSTGMGVITLDAAGNAALKDYLSNVDGRIKLFAKTDVDLSPGDPFPSGALTVQVVVTARVVGRLA